MAKVVLVAAILLSAGSVGWDYLNSSLELPRSEPPATSENRPVTNAELRALTYDGLVPVLDRMITWKPDSSTAFGYEGWMCVSERDLQGLEVLAWRVWIASGKLGKGVRKQLSAYYAGEKDFPKGVFLKEELRNVLLQVFESEREAMLAEREESKGTP